jgi:flagellar biosynthesis/type III secretory pathway protein FliH
MFGNKYLDVAIRESLAEGKKKGREEGKKEGREEGRVEERKKADAEYLQEKIECC